MVITLHSNTFPCFILEDGNSRKMLFQGSFHLTVEISTVNLVIALKNQDQMVNLVIVLKNQGTQMIQLVTNQVEVVNPFVLRDIAKQIELLTNQVNLIAKCSQIKLITNQVDSVETTKTVPTVVKTKSGRRVLLLVLVK